MSVAGGQTEALIRTLYFRLTGNELKQPRINQMRVQKDYKEVKIKMGKYTLGFAAVNSIALAHKLIEEIKAGRDDLHFIEVMVCPGGCINGGGQPIRKGSNAIKIRQKSVYDLDENDPIPVAHKNPGIIGLYTDFLISPDSTIARDLLHTSYKKREVPL